MTIGTLTLTVLDRNKRPASYDIYGRIDPLVSNGGSGAHEDHEIVIPTAQDGHFEVDLAPGIYNVRLYLPGGGIVQRSFEIEPGTRLPLIVAEPEKLGFSLQEAAGDASFETLLSEARSARAEAFTAPRVQLVPAAAKRVVKGVLRGKASGPTYREIGTRTGLVAGFHSPRGVTKGRPRTGALRVGGKGVKAGPRSPRVASDPSLPRLALSKGVITKGNHWSHLAQRTGVTVREDWQRVDPKERQGRIAIWRLQSEIAGSSPGSNSRRWARVRFGKAIELISLPAPWPCIGTSELSPIDILVDAAIRGRAVSSVAIHDTALDSLLTYLGRGGLTAARPVLEALDRSGVIERTIFAKRQNPLAACAAAYAGLALFDPGESERWDTWLPNIMDWFPWLPDGAIVHARRIMLRPAHDKEYLDALDALRRAYDCGIPYFSVGLRLMRDMLELLAEEHKDAAKMLKAVAPVAARSDPRPLFTVLRYPG